MEENLKPKDFQFDFREFDSWSLKHNHQAYEIYLMVSGEHDIYISNRKYHIKHGDVILIGPNTTHSYIAEGKFSRYEITFTKRYLDHFYSVEFRRKLMRCFSSEIVHMTEREIKEFCWLFEGMKREKEQNEMPQLFLANILHMLNILSARQLENPIIPEVMTKEMRAVTSVVAYINANYRSIRTMDEIADACFISKSYLCHVFKKEYDMTVMEFLKRVRIRNACEFLATSDKTFSLIASKMGFADISHFTKNFKRIMGCTPREYREKKQLELEVNKDEPSKGLKPDTMNPMVETDFNKQL